MLEIERKFLLKNGQWRALVVDNLEMQQAYLGGSGVSVRVRIAAQDAWLNIKQVRLGRARHEFEYPIPLQDARQLMSLAQGGQVSKIRHHVPHDGMVWEIDEFTGANAGLVVAEIELREVGQDFDKPAWLGREVTDDERYYNIRLASHPFQSWDSK